MKKASLLVILAVMILSGCAVRKHCFIQPGLLEDRTVTTGSVMISKYECQGRVTVAARDCNEPLEILYLGRTHPGNYLRIASRVGSRTQVMAETTYSENSKFINFQDAKIEVIMANDNSIRFKLVMISTAGCTKVNGQDVK